MFTIIRKRSSFCTYRRLALSANANTVLVLIVLRSNYTWPNALHSNLHVELIHVSLLLRYQRRQSGLKDGGSWILVKKFDFLRNFPKNFQFFQEISQTENRFFRPNFQKISMFFR